MSIHTERHTDEVFLANYAISPFTPLLLHPVKYEANPPNCTTDFPSCVFRSYGFLLPSFHQIRQDYTEKTTALRRILSIPLFSLTLTST